MRGKLKHTGGNINVFAVLKYPTQLVFLKRRDSFQLHLIVIDVWQHDRRGEQEANPHTLGGENILMACSMEKIFTDGLMDASQHCNFACRMKKNLSILNVFLVCTHFSNIKQLE